MLEREDARRFVFFLQFQGEGVILFAFRHARQGGCSRFFSRARRFLVLTCKGERVSDMLDNSLHDIIADHMRFQSLIRAKLKHNNFKKSSSV